MSNSGLELSLKYLTNKEKTKVLFAEVNSDFITLLLGSMMIPLAWVGSILRELSGVEEAAIGSLNSLYAGLLNLDDSYFCVEGARQMLIDPAMSWLGYRLCFKDDYFVCQDEKCCKFPFKNISLYPDIAKCECGRSLNRQILVAKSLDSAAFITNCNALSFIVTDDLTVTPMTGIIQILKDIGIAGIEMAEMESITLSTFKFMDVLKIIITSANPLTDIILKKRQSSSSLRSTNRFLFAVATHEFVELLFSFLTTPFGGVEFLLGGNTGLRNFDNIYKSISDGIYDEYLCNAAFKEGFINPKLPHGYVFENQILPLGECTPPKLYYQTKWNEQRQCNEYSFTHENSRGALVPSFKSNKELFIKKHATFLVTDDLTVSPSLATSISMLNSLGISPSDVKEMEIRVGLEEALRILKASLTSKTVLTDALMLNKISKLKQEP